MILSVNIDHIATIRNARNSSYPSLLRAMEIIKTSGGEVVTIHLREDRRHIKDKDAEEICQSAILPINFEIAPTEEMVEKAIKLNPTFVCFVPEKREELTTEGGLDIFLHEKKLKEYIKNLQNTQVSLFINPSKEAVLKASEIGAGVVELHTGSFAETESEIEFAKIEEVAEFAVSLGLKVHAGHGLTFSSARKIAKIKQISALHIGHFLITESIFIGLGEAVSKMKNLII